MHGLGTSSGGLSRRLTHTRLFGKGVVSECVAGQLALSLFLTLSLALLLLLLQFRSRFHWRRLFPHTLL